MSWDTILGVGFWLFALTCSGFLLGISIWEFRELQRECRDPSIWATIAVLAAVMVIVLLAVAAKSIDVGIIWTLKR